MENDSEATDIGKAVADLVFERTDDINTAITAMSGAFIFVVSEMKNLTHAEAAEKVVEIAAWYALHYREQAAH
jgi:hypothetical protein